jgi:multisite-specific tRNA:(cytosine-C5)-methyltransferase
LIDASSSFPELVRRPGVTTWKPTVDRTITFFDSLDDYVDSLPDERQKNSHKMMRSHWPPSNVDELNLSRWYVALVMHASSSGVHSIPLSIRIYPHHQDTGGFFIAILEKVQYPSLVGQTSKQVISRKLENYILFSAEMANVLLTLQTTQLTQKSPG